MASKVAKDYDVVLKEMNGAETHIKVAEGVPLGRVFKQFGDSDSFRFLYDGDRIRDQQTVETLDFEGLFVQIDVMREVHGGGCLPGPNLRDDSKVKVPWDEDAGLERMICHGLSIESEYDNKLIVGHIGLSKFNNLSQQYDVFNLNRNYKQAICKSKGVGPPSCVSMTDFYFYKCQVHFDGELYDGTEIDKKMVFKGSSAWHFKGRLVEWNYLDMTIISLDDIEKDECDSDWKMDSEIEDASENEHKSTKKKKRKQRVRSPINKTGLKKKRSFSSIQKPSMRTRQQKISRIVERSRSKLASYRRGRKLSKK